MKKLLLGVLATLLLLGAGYVYVEFNGYPWKHSQIKKDAAHYMQEKYGMDARAAGSRFNFKFDTYAGEVYDPQVGEEQLILVERRGPFYDSNNEWVEGQLVDNYSEVYWGRQTERQLRQQFASFYGHPDIGSINVDTVAAMYGMKEQVSSEKDAQGVLIPMKPELHSTWDIDLAVDDFSEPFLKELLLAIKTMGEQQLEADLNVTAARGVREDDTQPNRTRYLNLEYENFAGIASVGDLQAAIKEY